MNERDAQRQSRRNWVMHKHAIMKAQADTLWGEVIDGVLEKVKVFNEARPGLRFNTAKRTLGGIHLLRSGTPYVELKAVYGGDPLAPLRITIHRKLAGGYPAEYLPIPSIGFEVNDDGHLLFQKAGQLINAQELAELLFDTLIEGL